MNGSQTIGGNTLHWSIRAGWHTRADGTRRFHLVLWMLDPVSGQVPDAILLTPADRPAIRIVPTMRRTDVMRAKKVPQALWPQAQLCGFQYGQELDGNPVHLRIAIAGTEHDLGELRPSAVAVLEGREGWLFLACDANDSPAQYAQAYSPSREWRAGWHGYFAGLDVLRHSQPSIRSLSFVVAPSKESVCEDLYPLPKSPRALIDVFLEAFGSNADLFWPSALLRPCRDYAFDKVETHWTDFGARRTCEALLKSWGVTPASPPNRYRLEEGPGDLGDRMLQSTRALRPVADWPNPARLIFDNFALHHGNIRVWQNPKPVIDETLMIFGGSSADYMVRYLSAIFARIVSVYTAGVPDPDLIAHEQPARIILQISQRFLTRPAETRTDVFETARQKIEKGQIAPCADHAREMQRWRTEDGIDLYLGRTPIVAHSGNR